MQRLILVSACEQGQSEAGIEEYFTSVTTLRIAHKKPRVGEVFCGVVPQKLNRAPRLMMSGPPRPRLRAKDSWRLAWYSPPSTSEVPSA